MMSRRRFLVEAGCATLVLGASRWTRPLLAATWPAERQAGVFYCHADFPLERFDALWNDMAQLQQDLTRTLRIPAAEEPIHLFLFEQAATYRDYLNLHFPQVPQRKALYIKERGPGMVFAYLSDDFATDLRHESTHALLHAVLPLVPLWLDEGLAEYFEVTPGDRARRSPHLTKTQWGARLGQSPKLETLEQLGDLAAMGPTEYRYAWAWTHFLLHGPASATDELLSYLSAIETLQPPGVMSERLRRRMPDLDQQFREHFRRWKGA